MLRSPTTPIVIALFAAALAACGPEIVDEPAPVPQTPPPDLLERLRALDGVTAFEIPTPLEGQRAFSITIEQPQDHDDEDGASFAQRLVLLHRDEQAPMVLVTTGYDLFGPPETWADYQGELTRLLHANQLVVEHRFFGPSIPDVGERDWSKLSVEQSAADSHRIRTVLGEVFEGAWIATGASKGGMTALFHHVYHPDDLDGVVPYVAPLSFGQSDPRYVEWLAQIGPEDGACAARVRDLGVALVARVDELAPAVAAITPGGGGLRDELVRAAVASQAFGFKWSFWQSWGSEAACAALPDPDGPVDGIAPWGVFDAEAVLGLDENTLLPYGYQVGYELGSQAFDSSELLPYYDAVDWSVLPTTEMPWPEPPTFVPDTMLFVDAKLQTEAKNVLAIYGAWDPWTGGRITVAARNGSHVLIAPGVGHAAQIAGLSAEDRELAVTRLSEMAGVAVDASALSDPGAAAFAARPLGPLGLGGDRLAAFVDARERALRSALLRRQLGGR